MGSTLPYPRSKLRSLLKAWASEPLPDSINNGATLPLTNKPRSLGPTVDPIAYVAYTVFIRRLAEKVVRDQGAGALGAKGALSALGKAGAGARRTRKKKVKVGRKEIQRAKRDVMGYYFVKRRQQQT